MRVLSNKRRLHPETARKAFTAAHVWRRQPKEEAADNMMFWLFLGAMASMLGGPNHYPMLGL